MRLIEIARRVAERQLEDEIANDPDGNGDEGILELVQEISVLLPDWLDAVLSDRVTAAQLDPTWHECMARVNKLRRSHAPASAIASAQFRAAKEMMPLFERFDRDASVYLERSVALDPLVSALARLIIEHPESYPLAEQVREAVDEAIANINKGKRRNDEIIQSGRPPHTIADHFDEWLHLGRVFQKCAATFRHGDQAATEGNAIVRRWDSELTRPISPVRQDNDG